MKTNNKLYNVLYFLITILFVGIIVGAIFVYASIISDDDKNILGKISDVESNVKINFDELTNNIVKNQNNVDGNELLNSLKNNNSNNNNATEILSNASEGMLYNQLNQNSKLIYTKIKSSIQNIDESTNSIDFGTTFNEQLNQSNGSDVINNDFQLALDAFTADNPGLFYIDLSNVYVSTTITTIGTKKTYEVELKKSQGTFFAKEFEDKNIRNQAINQVESLKNQIVNSLQGTTKDKIQEVHDCLVENLDYDESLSRINCHNVYGALIEKTAVCEGYAKAFKYILDEANIPCMLITGEGTNSAGNTETHAWNYVKINGIWYAVDVTWDDPIVIGGGILPNDLKYKYFLKGSDTFFNNHVADLSRGFKYPNISSTEY